MKYSIQIILLALFSLISCKKDKLEDDKQILSGKWNWFYTEYSYGWCQFDQQYETILASETSESYSLIFTEKGKVSFLESGIEKETNRIVFEYFESDNQGGYFFFIKLNNKGDKILEGSVSADTLRVNYPLVETNADCENYLNFFVRE